MAPAQLGGSEHLLQRFQAAGIKRKQIAGVKVHLHPRWRGFHGLHQGVYLAGRTKKQHAMQLPVQLWRHRRLRQRRCGCWCWCNRVCAKHFAHAQHKQYAGQHQAHLHGHCQIKHHGEKERAQQQQAVVVGKMPQPGKFVPLAHVPGHMQQNAGQHRQRNVQRQGGQRQHDGGERHRMHHPGDRRGGTSAQIGHGAGNGAGYRHAAKKRHDKVGDALGHQLLVGVMFADVRVGGQLVGHAGAQQRLNSAQQGDGHCGCHQQAYGVPRQIGQRKTGQLLRNAAKAGAQGFYRQLQKMRQQREQHQRHHWRRHAGKVAHGVPFQPPRRPAAGRKQPGPCKQQRHAGQAQAQCGGVHGVGMLHHHVQLREKVAGHFVNRQAQPVFELRDRNQHRNAVGKANHDADRYQAHHIAQAQQPEREQQHPGTGGGNQQIRHAVALHNAVDDDDKCPRRAADLHVGAAQQRHQKTANDGRPQPRFGRQAAGNGKRHG